MIEAKLAEQLAPHLSNARPCPALAEHWSGIRFQPAAVLVLLVPEAGDTESRALARARVLLTARPQTMRHHAGQIAFPGGKHDPEDVDLAATALREANEEVGLDPGAVRLSGRLERVHSPSGFAIHPFVAVHAPLRDAASSAHWRSNREVDRLWLPSLAELAHVDNYRSGGEGNWNGVRYIKHEYHVSQPPVWGATARMVYDLLRRIEGLLPDATVHED